MPHNLNHKDYFDIIKKNHEDFLARNMLTHLGIIRDDKDNQKIPKCVEHIKSYYNFKAIYLNRSIKKQSVSSKLGHGALAALLGIGAGSLFFLSSKSSNFNDVFNPISNVSNVASGAFSTLIGAGVSVVAYQAWLKSSKAPAVDDFLEFNSAMKKAGFSDDKYTELSAKIVKLFHFRECLLLSLKDNFEINFKDEFKQKYLINNEEIDDETIDDAIEVFFLDKLSSLFNESFKNIYKIHDNEINNEKNQFTIVNWIKKLFENEEKRKIFTQQLQIQFMEQCLNFLEQQMLEPGYLAQYPLLTTSITGLISGAITLTLVSTLTSFLMFTAINISLVISVFSIMGMIYALENFDYIKFQRNSDNRLSLGKTIKHISKECHRLRTLVKNSVETTNNDLHELDNYKEKISDNGFETEFHLFHEKEEFIAIGAHTAWAREYASRYRHSKKIEIDLQERNEKIIKSSIIQSDDLYNSLIKVLVNNNPNKNKDEREKINKFIKDTKDYLLDKKNFLFINKFEIIQKIRQQILDIVTKIPDYIKNNLPKELESFYTSPITQGGLDGSIFDLQHARNISSPNNSYKNLLVSAQKLNFFLSKNSDNNYILQGDSKYRSMLGLQNNDVNIDCKVTSKNIYNYLNDSYNFLYSLNKFSKIEQFDNVSLFSDEFILFRMLLLKQLSNYVNPNNFHMELSVKNEICKFVKNKLFIDPKVILDDIFNQGLFAPCYTNNISNELIEDSLGKKLYKIDLEFISEAIRVDLAYTTKTITNKMLLDLDAKDFLSTIPCTENILFGYHNATTLNPEISKNYFEKILQAIANSRQFIIKLMDKSLDGNTGYLNFYIKKARGEITKLLESIVKLNDLIKEQKLSSYNSEYLKSSKDLLEIFKDELMSLLNITNQTQIPIYYRFS